MPRTVTVTFEDGGQHVYDNVPDNVTPDAIEQRAATDFHGKKLKGIDGGANRATTIPDVPPQPARAADPGFIDKAIGAGEAGLTLLTGATGGAVGMAGGVLGGIAGAIRSGEIRGPEVTRRMADTVSESAQRFTYVPRTVSGREQAQGLATLLQPLAALPPAAGPASVLAGPAAQQVRAGARPVLNAAVPRTEMAILRNAFTKDEPQMAGMGAAMTDVATLRNERAQSLPVPINLTRGQLERTFEQQRFERETAKLPKVGEPLRQRFADQNEQILRNFDAWVDQTGAQAPDLRATGQVVNNVLVEKAARAKAKINEAYDAARAANAMAEEVSVTPLIDYALKHEAEAVNAGVISSVAGTVRRLAGQERKDVFGQAIPRTMSINDLEEVRKMVNRTAMTGGPNQNAHHGRELIKIIDAITDEKGGPEYRYARSLNTRFKNEFENVGVIDRLLSTKPGTKDRSVAYEDVFKHSVLNGSLDDVRSVRKTLQTAGANGEQAWRELQGQTVNYLKEAASRNAQRDIRNNPVVSFAGLDRAVRSLDQDGKLDFIFGQKGAQQIRDIRDITADAVTAPPGSVNTSNTASVLLEAFSAALVGRLPTMAAKVGGVAKDYLNTRKVRGQVDAALNPFPQERPTGLAQLLPRN